MLKSSGSPEGNSAHPGPLKTPKGVHLVRPHMIYIHPFAQGTQLLSLCQALLQALQPLVSQLGRVVQLFLARGVTCWARVTACGGCISCLRICTAPFCRGRPCCHSAGFAVSPERLSLGVNVCISSCRVLLQDVMMSRPPGCSRLCTDLMYCSC